MLGRLLSNEHSNWYNCNAVIMLPGNEESSNIELCSVVVFILGLIPVFTTTSNYTSHSNNSCVHLVIVFTLVITSNDATDSCYYYSNFVFICLHGSLIFQNLVSYHQHILCGIGFDLLKLLHKKHKDK